MRFESFSDMLKYRAAASPEAPALMDGRHVYTFSGLNEAVEERAEMLRAGGKTCLAVMTEGTGDCVIEIFAANAAGLQTVLLDPSVDDDVLIRLVQLTDADAVYGDEELKEMLAPYLTKGIPDETDAAVTHPSDRKSVRCDRILFFTSGTTQSSKAVVLTGKSLCSSAWNGSQMLPLHECDTLLCVLPLNHVFGFVCGLLWGLSCGACVALGSGLRGMFTDFPKYRPTAVSVVPALLAFLLQNRLINPELKTLLIGAGDCPEKLILAAKAAGLSVSFGYGLTETSSGIAISTGGDPYALAVCPDDKITIAEDGEILIEAPTCIMQGYYKDPDSTAAVLKDGVLYSGDLGYLDEDGKLHVTGRKKEMLVLPDGTKIFLPEYEAKLASVLGQGDFAVTLKEGWPVLIICTEGSKEELVKKLRPVMDTLPRGQQLTDVIIVNEPLPRTATGKIRRWALKA